MAFLAGASSIRSPFALAVPSRRRHDLPTAVKATAANSSSVSPHPLISSLRLTASAAVLLAATSPVIACTPSPPPPPALTVTVETEDPIQDDSHPFEKLIVETAALSRLGGADAARARLSSAGGGEHYARLLAAQALFVDGKADEAIAAFQELAREDPGDYRPLFCQGVLYSVLGRAAESESMLERCQVIAGYKFGANFRMPVSEAEAETEAETVMVTEKMETEAQGEGEAEAAYESESHNAEAAETEAEPMTEKTETDTQGEIEREAEAEPEPESEPESVMTEKMEPEGQGEKV
jgi:hypothetical protein